MINSLDSLSGFGSSRLPVC